MVDLLEHHLDEDTEGHLDQSERNIRSRDQLWTNERSLCNHLAAARLLLLHGHEVEAGSGAGSRVSWRHHRRHCGDCSANWQKKINILITHVQMDLNLYKYHIIRTKCLPCISSQSPFS